MPESQREDKNIYNLTDHDLLIRMNVKVDNIEIRTDNFNKRLNKLENWKNYTAGGIAVLLLIVGFVATKI